MFGNIRYWNGITIMESPDLDGFSYEVHWKGGYICIGNAWVSGYGAERIF